MKKLCSFILLLIIFVSGCDLLLNDNPPSYIKDVVAYKEGSEGIEIYFILADDSGAMTTSDGTVFLTITETHTEWNTRVSKFIEIEEKLYSKTISVKKTDFRKAKVGTGAFEHEVILYLIGRVDYSSLTKKPSEMSGKVKVEFQMPNGKLLKGETTIFF